MTIVQTVLVYVVIPAAVLVLFAALTLWPKAQRGPRYRSGEGWDYAPVWWSANSEAVTGHVERSSDALASRPLGSHGLGSTSSTEQPESIDAGLVGGGARGTW